VFLSERNREKKISGEQEKTMPLQRVMSGASFSLLSGGGYAAAAGGNNGEAEVFRSMQVETTSKTPYSDATQVDILTH
jgi:hypothetical protein